MISPPLLRPEGRSGRQKNDRIYFPQIPESFPGSLSETGREASGAASECIINIRKIHSDY